MPEPTAPEIPAEIINYLAVRDRQRGKDVEDALRRRTPDEVRLMREAAVMGYVRGTMAPRDADIPKDLAILRMVVGACLAMLDLYPMISGYVPDEEASDA